MTLAEEEQLHEASKDVLSTWKRGIPALQAEIASLRELLSSLTTEENDAQEQLESLTYALGLTKGELERRERSNNELSTAYQSPHEGVDSEFDAVQRLEGELLNAKRDSANMEYEVERLEFRLKQLYDDGGRREPPSPIVVQSPCVGLSSPIGTASPGFKQGRLIGDVDGVIRLFDCYVPCRVGVSAGGSLGVYSYDTSEALLFLDERVVKSELSNEDAIALKEWLRSVEILYGECDGVLVGLAEGVEACVQIVREVGAGIVDVI